MIDYLINLGWNRDVAVFVASALGVILVACPAVMDHL